MSIGVHSWFPIASFRLNLAGIFRPQEFEIFHGDTLTNERDTLRELNPAKKSSFDAIVANPPLMRGAKAQGEVDKLTPTLPAGAFAGSSPPEPTDEPAQKLLERICEPSESKSHRDARA